MACGLQLDKAWGCRPFCHFFICPITQAACPPRLDCTSCEEARLKRAWLEVQRDAPSLSCHGHSSLRTSGEGHGGETAKVGVFHTSRSTQLCVEAISRWGGPGNSGPPTGNPIRIPKKCPRPRAPMQSVPGALWRQKPARGQPAPEPEPLQLPLPTGQKIEELGPLLRPVPKPDETYIHTHTHMHAHQMHVRRAGSTHPDQPA